MRTKILLILFSFIGLTAKGQSKEAPIPMNIPEIPIVEGERGYREVLILQDSTKNIYQELQLFLSNKYNSAKDVIDLSLDMSDQSTGIIVAKGKFQIATNSYSIMGKKYYKNITNYMVDHKITFEIKDNRVRATLNSFLVHEPSLDYTDIMGTVTRIDYPKKSIQEVIDFTQLSFLDSSLNGRINIAKRYAFSDFLNSFHAICEAYLDEVEVFMNQKKDNW
jgi:hypothetical protein